jgi:coenzyme F420-0:L-glutamate ligase / coenzyme F420-1:gamma-L-glutamate ligase
MQTVIDTIQARRSLRRYQQRPVPQGIIEQVLTAATWAPSAHNRQPWRFTVIQTAEVKVKLATAMGTQLRADLEADHVPGDIIDKDVNRSYERITLAPVLILLALTMADMDEYSDAGRSYNEYVMAIQSTAMAGQNLLLTAHEMGLGACWMCAPLFCPDVVRAALNLPGDWEPQSLITMGYPAQERERTRRPLERSVLWR